MTTDLKIMAGKLLAKHVQLKLPLWSEAVRALPNPLARSALFSVTNRRIKRRQYNRHKIVSIKGFELFYTGEELRQDDESVLLQLIHIVRFQPLGEVVSVTGNQLLTALGWDKGSKSYTRIRSCIERLKTGSITLSFDNGRNGYMGSLVRKVYWANQGDNDKSTKWQIYLEPEIIALFGDDDYSLIDWEQRNSLPPLAQWLHSFFTTHRDPSTHHYKVETIYGLCNSSDPSLSNFRLNLKKSLDLLIQCGFLSDWKLDPRYDHIQVFRNRHKMLGSVERV